MRDQISALEKLQKIDLELRGIEHDLEKYPQEISQYNNELQTLKESIVNKKIELEELNKSKVQMELNLKHNQELIKKAEERLFEIKTHKEYEALQKEITETKRNNSELEEGILSKMETLENIEIKMNEEGVYLTEKENEYNQKIEEFEKIVEELKVSYEPKKQEKEQIISQIKPDILPIYKRVSQRNGIALALAENEVCSGCNMNIPPQLFNEVLTLNKIIQCPNCKKILYTT